MKIDLRIVAGLAAVLALTGCGGRDVVSAAAQRTTVSSSVVAPPQSSSELRSTTTTTAAPPTRVAEPAPAATEARGWHHCEGPASVAIADPTGIVFGTEIDGTVTKRAVLLMPKIDGHPIKDKMGRVVASFMHGQPPVELLACHGTSYLISSPICGGHDAGLIEAFGARRGETRLQAAVAVDLSIDPTAC